MKRGLSILLTLAICMQFAMPVSAATQNLPNESGEIIFVSEISEITDGFMYLLGTSHKSAAILVNQYTGHMAASISFQEGEVYEFIFETAPYANFDPLSQESWNAIIEYMEAHLGEGKYLSIEIVEENIDLSKMKSSVGADLKEELKNLVGSEYSDKVLSTSTKYGCSMKIEESMTLRIEEQKKFSWSSAITVASLITTYLGVTATSAVVKTVCDVFGVAATASSLIPAGSAKKYLCRALVGRWTYVNNKACNTTYKYLDYYGIDDGNLNSSNPAHIYSGRTTSYSHSSSYFSSYSQQIEDAYSYYLSYY